MKRETLIAGAVFAAIPVVILAAALLCTWAVGHGASPLWRLPFRILCHGIPRRCLIVWGVPMPICARCTAIYLGLFAGLGAFTLVPWARERVLRVLMYAAAAPMILDGTTQLLRLRESTNVLRLLTGWTAAFVFGMWVLSVIERRGETKFTTS